MRPLPQRQQQPKLPVKNSHHKYLVNHNPTTITTITIPIVTIRQTTLVPLKIRSRMTRPYSISI
jgi:hypothetical protein